jgi:hypothetical protein
MQDSREIDYFGQRILQIVQPLAAGGDRREVLALLAQSIANTSQQMAVGYCITHRQVSFVLPLVRALVIVPIQLRLNYPISARHLHQLQPYGGCHYCPIIR